MTVVQPNSIAGINSITVQTGNSLSIHKSDGSLIRTITGSTGVTTFATLSVGTGYTDFAQGGGLNIGLGASISNGSGNVLTFGTGGDDRATIDASGNISVGSAATISANGNATFSGIVTTAQLGGDVLIEDKIVHAGDTNTALRFPANDTFTVETGGSEAFRVNSSGHIGVNATATNNRVEILQDPQGFPSDSAQPNATVLIKHGTSGTNRRWIGIGASLTGAWIQSSSPGGTGLQAPLWINRGGGEVRMGSSGTKLFVKHGGNIGVNTDAPAATTHISKSYISGGPTGGFDSNIVLAVTNNESASNYAGLALNAGVSGGAFIHFGDTADSNIGIVYYDHGDNSMRFSTNAGERLRITSTGDINVSTAATIKANGNATFSGIATATSFDDSKGDLRNIPLLSKSSGYTLIASDAGKCIEISTGGVTVPNSVMSSGNVVSIANDSGSNQTITQGSGVSLFNTGDASTGNRTLAGRGMATIWFANASTAYISGSGLS